MTVSAFGSTIHPAIHDSILQRILDSLVVDSCKVVLNLLEKPLIRLAAFLAPARIVERHDVSQAFDFTNFELVNVADLEQRIARRNSSQATVHVYPFCLELLK